MSVHLHRLTLAEFVAWEERLRGCHEPRYCSVYAMADESDGHDHIVSTLSTGPTYEIQIRTALQHAWASLVEILAAKDQSITYGGNSFVQTFLETLSDSINEVERLEEHMFDGFLDDEADDKSESLAELAAFFKKVSPDFFTGQHADFWNGIEDRHFRIDDIDESWASILSYEILDWKQNFLV